MAMWDIPSIESAGVSVVRDTKVSHREARVTCMRIYAEKYTWHPNNIFHHPYSKPPPHPPPPKKKKKRSKYIIHPFPEI